MANQEEDDLDLELLDLLSSFTVDTLSDAIISLDVSCSVIPPTQTLTKTDADDLVAADFALVDSHVNEDDGGVSLRVLDDYECGAFFRRMILLDGGSRFSIGDYINHRDVDSYEDDYDYDLDDELVPKSVSMKLKRQRIRKLGKRTFEKVRRNSKRSSYLQLKPGCVHGKHGLGINFRC